MAKGRHDIVPVIAADRAQNVTGFAAGNLSAFHQREITCLGGFNQCLEIGAGMVRDWHG
jgi:hypothetical protein